MATKSVTGVTAARMALLEASSIVNGIIKLDKHLYLRTHGGEEIDLGSAQGPAGPPGVGFQPKGAWNAVAAYVLNDIVTRTGQTWRAKAAIAAGQLPALQSLASLTGTNVWPAVPQRLIGGQTINTTVGGTSRWNTMDYKAFQLDVQTAGPISIVTTGSGLDVQSKTAAGGPGPAVGANVQFAVGRYYIFIGANTASPIPATITATPSGSAAFGGATPNPEPVEGPLWELWAARTGA